VLIRQDAFFSPASLDRGAAHDAMRAIANGVHLSCADGVVEVGGFVQPIMSSSKSSKRRS